MKRIILLLVFGSLAFAQAATPTTRNMVMSWGAPTSGVPAGGFTVNRVTGNAAPQQLYNGPNLAFTDTGAVVGATYTYTLTANPAPCAPITVTPTTPQTAPATPAACGGPAASLSFTITIPAAGSGTVVVSFTGFTQ